MCENKKVRINILYKLATIHHNHLI